MNILLRFSFWIVVVIYIIAWYLPLNKSWGVVPSEIYSSAVAYLLFLLLLIISISTKIGQKVYSAVQSVFDRYIDRVTRLPQFLIILLWLIIPAGLFTLLRNRVHLYGDGHLILGEIAKGEVPSTSAFLFSKLTLFLRTLFSIRTADGAETMVVTISIISGLIFIFCVFGICREIASNRSDRTWYFLIAVTCGITILFCGYIETYPFLLALSSLYIYFSFKSNTNLVDLWLALLILALGILWHPWFVVFVPSWIYLLIRRIKFFPNKLLAIIVAVGMTASYFISQNMMRSGIKPFLSLSSSKDTSYTLFSGGHLIDFANLLIFTGPFLVILGLILILWIIIKRYKISTKSIFLMYMFLPAIFLCFITDPALGAIRDWDLLSFFALPGILLSLTIISNMVCEKPGLKYMFVVMLVFNLAHLGGLIAMNKKIDYSVDRMIEVLASDPHYQSDYYYGRRTKSLAQIIELEYSRTNAAEKLRGRRENKYEDRKALMLANQFYRTHSYSNARLQYEKYLQKSDLPIKSSYRYAITLYMLNDYTQAAFCFKKVMADTLYDHLYYYLADSYSKLGESDSTQKYKKLYLEFFPEEDQIKKDFSTDLDMNKENDRTILMQRWIGFDCRGKFLTWDELQDILRE